MDDILASIRRIIADDYQGASRAEGRRAGGLRDEPALPPEAAADETPAEADRAAETWSDEPEAVDAAEPEPDRPDPEAAPAPHVYALSSEMISEPATVPDAPLRSAARPEASAPSMPQAAAAPIRSLSSSDFADAQGEPPREFRRPTMPSNAARAPDPRPEPLISTAATASVGESFHALSHTILSNNGARTLEDIVKDMLRPMLQVWLDDNLPPLVERLVRAEIERVARGRP